MVAEKLQGGRMGDIVWVGHGNCSRERSKPSFGCSVNGQDSALSQDSWLGSPILPPAIMLPARASSGWDGGSRAQFKVFQQKQKDHSSRAGSCILKDTSPAIFLLVTRA